MYAARLRARPYGAMMRKIVSLRHIAYTRTLCEINYPSSFLKSLLITKRCYIVPSYLFTLLNMSDTTSPWPTGDQAFEAAVKERLDAEATALIMEVFVGKKTMEEIKSLTAAANLRIRKELKGNQEG